MLRIQKSNQIFPTTELENKLLSQGYNRVIGVDEVGRGSWAGPVVVAGYIYHQNSKQIPNVTDSKKLTHTKRVDILSQLGQNDQILKSLANDKIDNIGIGKSIENLIESIVDEFDDGRTMFLIDGYFANKFSSHSIQIKKGDLLHYSIACASIIAKEYRDNFMHKIALRYNDYGFEKHVGYGTALHQQKLKQYGPCKIHRKSFKPIAKLFSI
jgi:ribonuclease HII